MRSPGLVESVLAIGEAPRAPGQGEHGFPLVNFPRRTGNLSQNLLRSPQKPRIAPHPGGIGMFPAIR
ncbi:hypothetical protein HY29_12455 [Hyphomonas beringensis]|uniref:Uncharacterized protein n=1 Tax=Hyphomonas beringensis TaxID=1280946 RepID=A0A062UGU2_9PROT|nr:hypothetical protein HY29_12455 [Hyphomonas beringensis]